MADIISNTTQLKLQHPKVYQDLYSRCFLVVSTPVKFFWGGEYGAHIGAPLIGQNLPLRTYVGLENLKSRGKIEITDLMYLPNRDIFKSQMDQMHRRKLSQYLVTVATSLYGTNDFPSLRISSLGETLPGSGLGMSGSFAAALAAALLLDSHKITEAEIADWSKTPTYLLPQNRSFDRVQRLAWKIASLLHDGISSGGACFLSLIGSIYPILYYSEKRTGLLASPLDVRVPLNIKENYQLLDRLFYGGIKLDELFGYKEQPSWPIEFYLVYSGDKGGGRSAKSVREIDDRLVEVSDMVLKGFDFLKTDPNILNPIFYQTCATDGWEGLHINYLGTPATVALEVLYSLKEMFELGGSDRSIEDLCQSINAYHDSLRILGRSTPNIRHMVHHFLTGFKRRLGSVNVGAKLTGGGRGGNLLVVTPAVDALETLQGEIAVLADETQQDIYLTYASTRDGLEERGLIIEQDLSNGTYSSQVSQGSVVFECFSKTNRNQITLSADEFEKTKNQMPLMFDVTTNDVFIRGRQLTSKDLKSAKATVGLFKLLLEHINTGIAKDALPHSSYYSDRNEIQSKIITPLQQIVTKTLRTKLPIKISGSLRQYQIALEAPTFDIYLLTKRV
jgi:mevalonate kinase